MDELRNVGTHEVYDVVTVGGSIAGCTAAILYGRAGLRVAVVERNRRPDAYKAMCGHFVLGGTRAMLERTGLWDEMVAAGAVASEIRVWNGRQWLGPAGEPPAISLRRRHLDPLLRRLAVATPGVDLLLGHSVTGLVEDGRRVSGVVATGPDGQERRLTARLVVGADGHRSPTATLAGVRESTATNERFLFWAYYEGLREPSDTLPLGRVWIVDPDLAVAVPTDDGLTLLGMFATKDKLDRFGGDRVEGLEASIASLPDAPDVSRATRVSKVIGTSDYPFVRRHPTPRPGLALVGDAACASDPVPAVGCGWAFRTAEWLVVHTADALSAGDDRALARGLRRYRRERSVVDRYDRLARTDARGRGLNPVQRALFTAAERDPEIASRLAHFGARAVPPSHVLNPRTVLRALWVSRRGSAETTSGRPGPAAAGVGLDAAGEVGGDGLRVGAHAVDERRLARP